MLYDFDLTNDFLFRHIFGDKRNSAILLSFVNAVFESKGCALLSKIEAVNPNLDAHQIARKEGILDVRAIDSQGRHYDIEIQVRPQSAYIKRSLYYVARMYGEQLTRGEDYGILKPCIGINILDYVLFRDSPLFHQLFTLQSVDEPGVELTRDITLHYLELPKLDIPDNSHSSLLEKWLYLLKKVNNPEDTMIKEMRTEIPELDRVAQEYAHLMTDEQIKIEALSHEMWLHDQTSYRNDARAEGLAEGIRAVARKFKEQGLDIEQICAATGLTTEEVAAL
jgi:predicted transposase/invertase (TIGR01784 family)